MKKKEETVFSEIFRNSKRKNLNSTNSWSPCKKRETRFVPFSSRILIANSFRKPKRPLIFHSERNNLANDNESVRDRKANDRKPGGHPSLSKGRANAAVRKRYDSTTFRSISPRMIVFAATPRGMGGFHARGYPI